MEVNFKFKSVKAFSPTWAVARKQSELESALDRLHLEDMDQSQSPLQGVRGMTRFSLKVDNTFWIATKLNQGVWPFAAARQRAES